MRVPFFIITGISLYLCFLTLFRFPSAWVGSLKGLSKDRPVIWFFGQLAANVLSFLVAMPKWIAGNLMILTGIIGAAAVVTGFGRQEYFLLIIGLMILVISLRHILKILLVDRQSKKVIHSPINLCSQDIVTLKDIKISSWGKPAHSLLGDIWLPREGAQRSGIGIIFLHSGGWGAFERGMTMQWLFRNLVRRGHLILDLGYPLAPEADMQEILESVKNSVAWLKTHARTYGIDPGKVILWGISGGGQLALQVAYTLKERDQNVVRAVISCYGPTDMAAHFKEYGLMEPFQPRSSDQIKPEMQPRYFNQTWVDRLITRMHIMPEYRYQNMPAGALLLVNLMGGTLTEVPNIYHNYSPLNQVSQNSPPTLQIWPAHDFYFSAVLHGRLLHHKLSGLGVQSSYLEIPDTEHGFDHFLAAISPAAWLEEKTIERFLAEV